MQSSSWRSNIPQRNHRRPKEYSAPRTLHNNASNAHGEATALRDLIERPRNAEPARRTGAGLDCEKRHLGRVHPCATMKVRSNFLSLAPLPDLAIPVRKLAREASGKPVQPSP